MTEVFADVMTLNGEEKTITDPGMLLHGSRDALW
jgi:hypothetical protein